MLCINGCIFGGFMATIYQPPRLQLGDAPLNGYAGSERDRFALVWQTTGSLSTDRFLVEYRPVGSNTWIAAPTPSTIDTGVGSRVNHTVTITGVDYDAAYEYRVRHFQGNQLIATHQEDFRTRLAAGDSSGFTFAAYGDSAGPGREEGFLSVQNRVSLEDPDFVLLLGDNAYDRGTHGEYDYRFVPSLAPSAVEWQAGHIEYSAIGNHDIQAQGGRPYRESYELPVPVAGVDSPAAPSGVIPEHNYSFDYGNVHFVTFDSNTLNDPVALDNVLDYVEADLAASTAQWNIVFPHHPIAGVPDKGEDPGDNYYRQVVTRLNAAGADLLLVGHSHTYGWTYPLTGFDGNEATFVFDPDKVYEKGAGLIQTVAGNGGTNLRRGSFDSDPFVASGYSLSTPRPVEHGFAQVSVTDRTLTVDYVAADDGEIIDSFQIVDNGSSPNPNPTPTPVPDAPDRAIFQQGINGYQGVVDTYLQAASPNANNSNATSLNVDSSDGGGEVHGLIRFENIFGTGSSEVPFDAEIQSAFLELNITDPGNSLQLHNLLQNWPETATWNSFDNGIQANGSEASSNIVASSGSVSTGVIRIDVTESLQAWQANPSANFGWALLPTGSNGVDFESSEGGYGPRLVVDFDGQSTPDGGSNTTGPAAFFSPKAAETINGIAYQNEDIIAFDGNNFSLFFDGSDLGLSGADINALDIVSPTEALISFSDPVTLNIGGSSVTVDDSDVVRFTATSSGNSTAGSFEWFLDGSDIGLTTSSEDVDGIHQLDNGDLLISTTGSPAVSGISGRDEDILLFQGSSYGASTSGTWSQYFDGSDVGLGSNSGEDVDALSLDASGSIYLSTLGQASASGLSAADEDVAIFNPSSLGSNTAGAYAGLFFDGSTFGLTGDGLAGDIGAFAIA